MAEVRELIVTRLGAQGDGVAEADGQQFFVPYALAGERVRAAISGGRGQRLEILDRSADRIAPVCRHFTRCGGCAIQHLSETAYAAWKRETVVAAFRARGIDAPVGALVRPAGLRRRAVFSAKKAGTGMILGFHEPASESVVDVIECPILSPSIVAALPGLRRLISPFVAKDEGRLSITLTVNGLDVAFDGTAKRLTPAQRAALAHAAAQLDLARLSFAAEPVYEARPATLKFGPAKVVIPPATFIQAVADVETHMSEFILAHLGKVKSVADLFCGAGALTFPVATKVKVAAFDSDMAAIGALNDAVKQTRGIKPVTARVRDLVREPLSALELNEHEAVVFDPPRAGADAQCKMIAKSKVKTVIAVSCNPATLARDARTLIDGGYGLESIMPIDQFRYSPHVEVIAVFKR